MECLGSCDTAPVALFNDVLHENLSIEAVDRLVEEARANLDAGHGGHG